MNVFKISEEEKRKILENHKNEINTDKTKKEELKKGLQKPNEKTKS
jgi:hypothetical protein